MNSLKNLTSFIVFFALLPSFGAARAFHTIPANLSTQKVALVQYHDSGQYYKDISAVTRRALYYLKFRINQNKRSKHQKKLAIVFDIDETALSNYDDMVHLDFGGTMHSKEALELDAHDPAIPYSRTLYSFAKNHGVYVFFVTGRREKLRDATVKNLLSGGYKDWAGLYMKPNLYQKNSITPFKVAARKKIVMMGYDIILNVSDQDSGLAGGFSDMAFKLPDPFYRVA